LHLTEVSGLLRALSTTPPTRWHCRKPSHLAVEGAFPWIRAFAAASLGAFPGSSFLFSLKRCNTVFPPWSSWSQSLLLKPVSAPFLPDLATPSLAFFPNTLCLAPTEQPLPRFGLRMVFFQPIFIMSNYSPLCTPFTVRLLLPGGCFAPPLWGSRQDLRQSSPSSGSSPLHFLSGRKGAYRGSSFLTPHRTLAG